ncbi:MAG TPA: 5-dehydro-4-deoxy-D-glucuronate isomerase [Acidisphaera sp.]|nr:5-dehydro-4-deoxy-D-glucuronate isomerase [Acidisphaera sp.]
MSQQTIETRSSSGPDAVRAFSTEQLRREFLIQDLFTPSHVKLVYSHVERMIIGGAMPVGWPLQLQTPREVGQKTFLARRELAAINIGGAGTIAVDGTVYEIAPREALYVGMGAESVAFRSTDNAKPARFYLLSAPAHRPCPTRKLDEGTGKTLQLGDKSTANERSIHQMLIPGAVESCQLVFGMTTLAPGSVWNTMPCHTHSRRNEVYLYFDLAPDARVFHFMGEPQETRHLVMAEGEAVISPPWSIHCGAGTGSYTFIWAMAGDNQDYGDMDMVATPDLR